MNSHTPAGNWNPTTQTMELNGRSLCGKRVDLFTADKPSCGQCARNRRTITGIMRDASGTFAALFTNDTKVAAS